MDDGKYMKPKEQANRVIQGGGPEIFYVIAGHMREWRIWSTSYMTCCDLEHRLNQEFLTLNPNKKTRLEFLVHIAIYDSWVRYRYLSRMSQLDGAPPFQVIRIGNYKKVWTEQQLEEISYRSQHSFKGTGYEG